MLMDHCMAADVSLTNRSRVTNGRDLFLDGVDGRSAEARRFRDVLAEIVSDLGGADHLSEGERQLARRCAMLSVEAERMEATAVGGGDLDLEAYGSLTNTLWRALSRIGLRRRQHDVELCPKVGDGAIRRRVWLS